ncbi:hypothetical protein ACF0H5_021727 [Mactra antiquata]
MAVKLTNDSLYFVNEHLIAYVTGVNLEFMFDVQNVPMILLAVVAFICLYFLYGVFFRPLNRVRLLGEFGYLSDGKLSKKEVANRVKRRRAVGEIPPVYPNGWFGLLESWQIKVGESKAVSALGQELAVFRDTKGEVHILDAYCPHMGAHLAVGGRVVDNCLECPFHGWRFRGHDGKCTFIPYADKVPEVSKIKSWTSMELNGWIYIWHHAEGAEPYWKLPELEEVTSGAWQYKGRTEHYINAHIEEVPENGADVAHLKMVHEPFIAAGVDLLTMWNKYWSWGKHSWQADWSQLPEPEGHIGSMKVVHDLVLFGIPLPFLKLKVNALQIGPGVVYLMFESFFGKGVFIHNLIPVEPIVQKLIHNIYIQWYVPNIVAKFFMLGEAIHIERDIMIWNNKTYNSKPVYSKSKQCGLISRHRRWYSQFYSEHSPRLKFQKDTLDW